MQTHYEGIGLFRLINDIYMSQEDDIGFGCDAAAATMERCAESLLSDEESQAQYPKLWRHFHFCEDCRDEYQMLMDIAQLEAAGGLIEPKSIPPIPTEQPTSFALWFQDAKEAIIAIFTGFPRQPATMRRSRNQSFEPVEPAEIELDEGNLILTFDVTANSKEPDLRELFCFVEKEDEALQETLEFAPVWLQQGPGGPVIQEQALNDKGNVTFSFLSPGPYTFRLYLAGQEYVVEKLVLP